MSVIYSIARKEFRGYFSSIIGYLFLAVLLLITGIFFSAILGVYIQYSEQAAANPGMSSELPSVSEFVLGNMLSNVAVIVLIMTPMLTMRLIAEELRQHSFELLMTSPVSSGQIVLGKFFGALAFFAIGLLCTLHYPLALIKFGSPDIGPMITGYLGAFLFSAACLSFGMLASSLTQHQLAAAALAFGFVLLMWIINWGSDPGDLRSYLSLTEHYDGFVKGFIKLESVVYYLSFTVFFLFATQQRLETMRRQ